MSFSGNVTLLYCEDKITGKIAALSVDLKYFISVSVRPGFGGLVSVSVRFGRNPKKSFRSDTTGVTVEF